jgi:hypothetical protein
MTGGKRLHQDGLRLDQPEIEYELEGMAEPV